MRIKPAVLALAALVALIGAAPAQGQSACPSPNAMHAKLATRFVTSGALAAIRDSLGISAATESNVRLLTDAQDQATCTHLRQLLVPGAAIGSSDAPWAFYTVGGYYLVLSAEDPAALPANVASTGLVYLGIVDSSFQLRKSLLM